MVTLLLALVVMVGWVRSLSVLDGISFTNGRESTESLASAGGFVAWQSNKGGATLMTSLVRNTVPLPDDFDGFNHPAMKWRCRSCGFGVGEIPAEIYDGTMITIRVIPYWSIVLPLTLFSAYLLLSKPQKSTPKTIPEPTANDGA
jgi:hypothetical protein